MPSREAMVATATEYAVSLGWQVTEVEDTGLTVVVLLTAPGASEQMVDAPLSKLRKALKDLGGPEDQDGAIEEYDLPENVEAGEEECEPETVYVEQAETQEELDAALREARMDQATDFPDPEAEWDAATEEEQATEPYDPEWAERDLYGPSLKELHRALEGDGDTGPDGIPRPEQLLPAAEEETMQPGGLITAKKEGEKDMRFGYRINAGVKKALELDGWTVTHLARVARGDSTVAIERSGRVTIQNVNGRLLKSAGGMLTVSKGDRSFQAKSVSVDYAKAGWLIS